MVLMLLQCPGIQTGIKDNHGCNARDLAKLKGAFNVAGTITNFQKSGYLSV